LTSKIIEPSTEKTWTQGCVIQQKEKWLQVEFIGLSEENILNENYNKTIIDFGFRRI